MAKPKQTILITGAGKRIGAALAQHFAAQGHDLVLHYAKSKAEAEALAKELRKQVKVTLVKADLADTGALKHFWKGLPACTVFIHNASVFKRDTLDSLTPASLGEHVAVHLEAPILLAQGFMKQLPKKAAGNILIIGDAAMGWSVAPPFFSYAISKHAWQSAIDILAAAVAPRARANVIAPGPTLRGPKDTAATFAMLAEKAPLKRTTSVKEIAQAADYLLAAEAVTGQVLTLANGFELASFRRGLPAA